MKVVIVVVVVQKRRNVYHEEINKTYEEKERKVRLYVTNEGCNCCSW